MQYQDIAEEDQALIKEAIATVERAFDEQHHRLVTAVLTEEGNIHYGINLLLNKIRRASACSESGAISSVVLNKEHPKRIVTVRKPMADEIDQTIKVVNPCGLCREMLTDYYPDIEVIINDDGKLGTCRAVDLLPLKY